MSLVASVAGVSIAALTSFAVLTSFRLERPSGVLALQAAISVLIAALGAVVWDRAFRISQPAATQGAADRAELRGMSAEDADVDELLRLIATAEDKIANQHTTHGVVMITDMKSFSRMTEEEGSFVTAKAVQRHRDLLLPVIESHGGKGKSTGGDGLVATFDSAEEAVCAAREMQQTLERHNAAHGNEREILVRVGIAEGEVVLDKGGRPFIGAALNVAARVMSLGDGGQVLVTRDIASKTKTPDVVMVSHGEFELKNISQRVEVLEVLWRDGQSPCDPRTFSTLEPETSTEVGQPG
jgi:class 3 adenylate cyclase